MSPREINAILDAKIFGQEDAKKTMSLAFYMHLTRNGLGLKKEKNLSLPKPNVIIMGNAGSGKTLMTHTLCSHFQLPIINIDGGLFLNTPNIGEMLDAYLRYLVLQFGLEKACSAVFSIDSFDELCNRQQLQPHISLAIQQDLLQMIEQKERMLIIEQGKQPIKFPLDNLMFIFSGRFPGIDSLVYMRSKIVEHDNEIIKRKEERLALVKRYRSLNKKDQTANQSVERIGFNTNSESRVESEVSTVNRSIQSLYENLKQDELEILVEQAFQKEMMQAMNDHFETESTLNTKVAYQDLINYGVMPELAGRLGFIAKLDQLSAEDIVAIIKKADNNIISQYKDYFNLHDDKLDIKEEVYTLIAEEVVARKIGTRSIDAIIIKLLEQILYDSPNDKKEKFVVDKAFFERVIG